MTLKTRDEELTLDIGHRGLPFVRVTAKTTVTTVDLNLAYRGLPFVATEAATPPTPDEPDGAVVQFIIVT